LVNSLERLKRTAEDHLKRELNILETVLKLNEEDCEKFYHG
jgi:hypothetical protein